MSVFSCAQGVCLSCNVTGVLTSYNTSLGLSPSAWLGNATLIALDPGTQDAWGGCSTSPSQCANAGVRYERWVPQPGCHNVLGGAKSVFCAAARAGPALLAAGLALLLLAVLA